MDIKKIRNNIYFQFNNVNDRMLELENRIIELEHQLNEKIQIIRCHLMRVKNNEDLSDNYLLRGLGYQDLNPEKAFKLYNNNDYDFIIIDVSKKDYMPPAELPEAKHIPLEELLMRHQEVTNHQTPIFVISEDGTRSILACKVLNQLGYYNVNNISGGHRFWPGHQSPSFAQSA